jgi:hypothetical protein
VLVDAPCGRLERMVLPPSGDQPPTDALTPRDPLNLFNLPPAQPSHFEPRLNGKGAGDPSVLDDRRGERVTPQQVDQAVAARSVLAAMVPGSDNPVQLRQHLRGEPAGPAADVEVGDIGK